MNACLNGGIAEGTTGNCECDCAGTGYSGNRCENAIFCVVSNSGLPGTINCLNGGTATGYTSIGCGCNCAGTGYSGTTCQNAASARISITTNAELKSAVTDWLSGGAAKSNAR